MESRHHGTELVQEAVYEFHKPNSGERIEVEIVFMHGLQVSAANLKDAYYKTWRTADGKEVWPETWLKEKYPSARILSLAYDSCALQTRETGNMDPYLLGESLLDQMVSTAAKIGQNDCPVVFVGHSLGGLIAKEIVVRCTSDHANVKHQNLLRNLKAVFFYATPHGGSDCADSWITKNMAHLLQLKRSLLVQYLKPEGTSRTRIHDNFLRAVNKDCRLYVVAEGRETKLLKVCNFCFKKSSVWIVKENSARLPGCDFVELSYADHKIVCKPQRPNDTGYLKLIDCIDQVTKKESRKITVGLSVENPIGIDDKMDGISSLLKSSRISMVFLFGMGGAGKTTLSKAFYNREAFKYEKSCYLENVTSKKVSTVQNELLRGLCGQQLNQDEHVEVQHVDKIKDCFLTQKVLVVIDDVSLEEHLQELQVFHALETGSQSKVVVTGRNKGILPRKYVNSGKAKIQDVNGIRDSKGSDLELFLRYAFDGVPEDDKEKVKIELLGEAKKIVQLCDGLPLSLEVLGKYLGNSRDEDLQQWKKIWVEAYERLHRAQTMDGSKDDKLWSSLRISYDHLADFEKKMFLDFSCIFSKISEVKKEHAELIWDSPMGVKNLIDRSLLKVEPRCLVMHNQLRDMGQHLLLKEALNQHPIYFWMANDLDDLFETYIEFKCYRDLRWLYLSDCSSVTKIGIEELGGLRVLQIISCRNIVELPEAIGNLMNLVEIKVSKCPNLRSLPNTIGKLKNLKRLLIESSGLQSVPDSVGELPEVEHLSFYYCDLTEIHGTQICTENLKTLKLPIAPTNLRRCPQLQRLEIHNHEGMIEFLQDLLKTDYVPELEEVIWWNPDFVDVTMENPDGSKLVLKRSLYYFKVHRDKNGSISRLIDFMDWPWHVFHDYYEFHSGWPLWAGLILTTSWT